MKKILVLFMMVMAFIVTSKLTINADYLTGEPQFNNIVIFIRFNDEQNYNAPYGLDYYEDLFNGVDQISLRDYYLEASYDQLTIDSYLVSNNNQIIYYTDDKDRSYYEPFDAESNPSGYKEGEQSSREHDLLKKAVDYVDEHNLVPDSLDLDVNEDGEIDSITFMVSGEDSGWNTLLWPHKWSLFTYHDYSTGFYWNAPSINGVHALEYTVELLGNSTSYDYQVSVGILAHETFHLLSAPDLYHYYDYLEVEPVGSWGLMDNAGDIPSHMLSYMKYEYGGWITDIPEIKESGTYTLYPIQDGTSNAFKIKTKFDNQWIYLEYRDNDGFYESNLPDTGLIVYRVNTSIDGNEYGSYDDEGNPTDEVFVYRPGMVDTTAPIILEGGDVKIDGYINSAALSQDNSHDQIGLGTDLDIFSSGGSLLNIGIYNVTEYDGYVIFDVYLDPYIELVTNTIDITDKEVILYDNELMKYEVSLENIPSNVDVYYTLDGTTPSETSTVYSGENISIDATNNNVRIAVYDQGQLMTIISKEYTFKSTIESDHGPYGDELDAIWYFDFVEEMTFSLEFNGDSHLEDGYDYLDVITPSTIESYTGDELDIYKVNHQLDHFALNLRTDTYVSEYYGFLATITPIGPISFTLSGSDSQILDVDTTYNEEGYVLYGFEKDLYTVEVISDLDMTTIGEYIITYNLLDPDGVITQTKTRKIEVVDRIAPEVTLNGESYIEVEAGTEFIDPFVTVSDNYDSELDIRVEGTVDTSTLDYTILEYFVTDSSGNLTYITREVQVVDTVAPTVALNEGVDTVYVNEEWIDGGINATDNLSTRFTYIIKDEPDTTVPGRYEVIYEVFDSSDNKTIISRIVHVVDKGIKIEDEIECTPTVTTLKVLEEFVFPTCTIGDIELEQTNNINNITEGVYEVVYSHTFHGYEEYTFTIYVLYYEDYDSSIILYFEKRRDLI